jgi:hypothetical protein
MTNQEVIAVMLNNPYKKFTHTLFAPDEYIYSKSNGIIYDENGYVFEDWYSHCDGMRIRTEGYWQEGWSIKE